MKNEKKITYLDYKTIQEKSYCIDCTIDEADFDTNRPNPRRIDTIVGDIKRYLKRKTGGNLDGVKYRGTRNLY